MVFTPPQVDWLVRVTPKRRFLNHGIVDVDETLVPVGLKVTVEAGGEPGVRL